MDGTTDASTLEAIDIQRIMELLPHRYPFLLVDRIVEINGDQSAVGIKNVTINEPFFPGHFPQRPIMPGVLIVEALAQTAGAMVLHHLGDAVSGSLVYFMTIEKARFRKPVEPGHVLRLHVEQLQQRRNISKFAGRAMVNGKLHADAEFSAMLVPPDAA